MWDVLGPENRGITRGVSSGACGGGQRIPTGLILSLPYWKPHRDHLRHRKRTEHAFLGSQREKDSLDERDYSAREGDFPFKSRCITGLMGRSSHRR